MDWGLPHKIEVKAGTHQLLRDKPHSASCCHLPPVGARFLCGLWGHWQKTGELHFFMFQSSKDRGCTALISYEMRYEMRLMDLSCCGMSMLHPIGVSFDICQAVESMLAQGSGAVRLAGGRLGLGSCAGG